MPEVMTGGNLTIYEEEELMHEVHPEIVKVGECEYELVWFSLHACALCTEDDIEEVEVEGCPPPGYNKLTYRWKEPKVCAYNPAVELPRDVACDKCSADDMEEVVGTCKDPEERTNYTAYWKTPKRCTEKLPGAFQLPPNVKAGPCQQTVVIQHIMVGNATVPQLVVFHATFDDVSLEDLKVTSVKSRFEEEFKKTVMAYAAVEEKHVKVNWLLRSNSTEGVVVSASVHMDPEDSIADFVYALETYPEDVFAGMTASTRYTTPTIEGIQLQILAGNTEKQTIPLWVYFAGVMGGLVILALGVNSIFSYVRYKKMYSQYSKLLEDGKEQYLGDSFQLEDAADFERQGGSSDSYTAPDSNELYDEKL